MGKSGRGTTPAEELVGSPALAFNPEALGYWDCNGPTLSLNLVFGVLTAR